MTAQVHERLIYNGEETSMAFCPPIPEDNARVITLEPEVISSACWREYVGTWEIKDGRFYLVDIEGKYHLDGHEPLLADWFTGVLRIPRGKRLVYVHMGFGSVYEEELHVHIRQGSVTETRVMDNRGKKHDRWKLGFQNLPGAENFFDGDGKTEESKNNDTMRKHSRYPLPLRVLIAGSIFWALLVLAYVLMFEPYGPRVDDKELWQTIKIIACPPLVSIAGYFLYRKIIKESDFLDE